MRKKPVSDSRRLGPDPHTGAARGLAFGRVFVPFALDRQSIGTLVATSSWGRPVELERR